MWPVSACYDSRKYGSSCTTVWTKPSIVQSELLCLVCQCLPRDQTLALSQSLVFEDIGKCETAVRSDLTKRDSSSVGLVDQKLP